jgi:transposase-like protein
MDTNETKKQGRVSYSAEERRGLLAEFESSGVTQAAFCREWNINPATLGKWLRAGHEEEEAYTKGEQERGMFAKALLSSSEVYSACLRSDSKKQVHEPKNHPRLHGGGSWWCGSR